MRTSTFVGVYWGIAAIVWGVRWAVTPSTRSGVMWLLASVLAGVAWAVRDEQ